MRPFHIALALLLAGLCWFSAAAVAGEVESRAARITRMEAERTRLDTERKALDQKLQAMAADVKRLKAERSSWNRDRKLERRLAESKEVASALDARQRQIRALDARIVSERKDLVAAIDREMAATPAPPEARRDRLARLRADATARLPRAPRRLRAVDTRIDPLDDPEDLEAKAAELAQNENQIRAEEARMERRAGHFRRLASLERSRQRSAEMDLFRDDQPRRQTRGTRTETTTVDGRDDGPTAGENPPPGGYDPSLDGDANGPVPPSGSYGGADTAVALATIYAEVVEPGTLDELARAERSGDPEAQAKAAERARADLRARAEKLRQRRLEMQRRARALRQSGE